MRGMESIGSSWATAHGPHLGMPSKVPWGGRGLGPLMVAWVPDALRQPLPQPQIQGGALSARPTHPY